MFHKEDLVILQYMRANQPCKAYDVMEKTGLKQSRVYAFLRREFIVKSDKIKGTDKKSGGYFHTYSINEEILRDLLSQKISPTKQTYRISHHPIMKYFYGLKDL